MLKNAQNHTRIFKFRSCTICKWSLSKFYLCFFDVFRGTGWFEMDFSLITGLGFPKNFGELSPLPYVMAIALHPHLWGRWFQPRKFRLTKLGSIWILDERTRIGTPSWREFIPDAVNWKIINLNFFGILSIINSIITSYFILLNSTYYIIK